MARLRQACVCGNGLLNGQVHDGAADPDNRLVPHALEHHHRPWDAVVLGAAAHPVRDSLALPPEPCWGTCGRTVHRWQRDAHHAQAAVQPPRDPDGPPHAPGRPQAMRYRSRRRLTPSTRRRYVSVAPPRKAKYAGGSGTNPRSGARDVNGSTTPTPRISTVVSVRGRLGRLRSGLPAVRMMKMTSVCVARDSTNQPV